MADSTISQLPLALSVSASDVIPIDQGGVTKRTTLGSLGTGIVFAAPGKYLTINNTLTFQGTDGTTITFPGTSATMARTDAAQSFSGLQTFTDGLTTPSQITSTIVTGTAPFVVASTTPVANLGAATATALQTARNIDGVSFDGTADITVIAPATHAAPSKATPIDADEIPLYDSVTALLAGVTWANIKATLKTYFDTLYAAVGSYAALAGSATQVFSVAAATLAAHTVRADQPKSSIIHIEGTTGSNALTVTLKAGAILDFRSTTLTTGVPDTVFATADISMVVSSGSTLGTISGIQSRIIILAINNAGTIELAVVNFAGGNNLDETSLISTTAEGGAGAADTINVIYSTTARSNVAYRVIGYVDSTQTTAGTWAQTLTVQGAGGNVLTAMSNLGYGQTWQAVTRTSGTTYYNTTGKPIALSATIINNAGAAPGVSISINGGSSVNIASTGVATGTSVAVGMIIIPPSVSYVLAEASVTSRYIFELR